VAAISFNYLERNIDDKKVIIIAARIHHIKVLSTQMLPIVKSNGIVQLSTRIVLAKASVLKINKFTKQKYNFINFFFRL
jgi:hypothetical protein